MAIKDNETAKAATEHLKEIAKTASVIVKVVGGGEQSAWLEITTVAHSADGEITRDSQKMRLMVGESFEIKDMTLRVL
jgi:hypothetical protein